tara:strand:- start:191 stop:385 length:195 start_codon:yes stop_codon:yes gene_type:complete
MTTLDPTSSQPSYSGIVASTATDTAAALFIGERRTGASGRHSRKPSIHIGTSSCEVMARGYLAG